MTLDPLLVLRLEVGPVDLARRLVRREDQDRTLTTKEAELLAYVAASPGRDIPREELLEQVWGYGPDVVSRTADTTMQRLRAKIERDPANPRHLLTVHGLGYRFEGLQGAPSLRSSDELDHATGPQSPSNLRPDASAFVGREEERAELLRRLRGGQRLLTLLGGGGAGKTRLAREVGLDLVEGGDFAGGVWFCELTEARDPAAVLSVVGRALEVELGTSVDLRDPADRIGQELRRRGASLLILDNAEQVLESSATLFAGWKAAVPDVRFLVTSRERLRIAGEQIVELDPLPQKEAIALFLLRASAARPDLTADAAVRDEVSAIVQRLDGLPLAIELVAPRVAVMDPEQIRRGLDSRFRLASSTRRDLPERQRTLRAALDWSWELLSPSERACLAQLTCFRGGFTTPLAEALVALPDDAPWVPDLLQSLLDKSLLRRSEPVELPGEARLGMLESVLEYALEKLEVMGRAPVEARHRAVVLAEGERLVTAWRADDLRAWRRLGLEADNLWAVLSRDPTPDEAARATLLLEEVLAVHGPAERHRALLDAALPRAEQAGADPRLLLGLLLARARSRRRGGSPGGAREDAERALTLGKELGGVHEAEAEFAYAMVIDFAGHPAEAEPRYADAERRFEEVGSVEGVLRASVMRAFALWQIGELDRAEPMLRQGLARVGEVSLWAYSARNLALLGLVLGARGRWEEALEVVREGSFGNGVFGSRRGESLMFANLGAFASARGDIDEGVRLTAEALRLHPADSDPLLRAVMLRNLGLLEADRGDHGEASEHLRAALELHQGLRDDLGCARVWLDLGELALLTGAGEDARAAAVKAMAAAQDSGDRRQIAITQAATAVMEHLAGGATGAGFDEAMRAVSGLAGPRIRGVFQALGAAVAADRGELLEAEAALAEAGALLESLGDRQGRGVLRLCRAVVQLAEAREASGAEAAVLRERAARGVAALADEHDAYELAVPRLLYERARAGMA